MSVVSTIQRSPDEQAMRPQQAASPLDDIKPAGWLDAAGSAANVAVDQVPSVQDARVEYAYRPVVEAVAKAMGKSTLDYLSPAKAAWALLPFTNHDLTDYDALWQDIGALQKAGRLPQGVPTDRQAFVQGILTRGGNHQRDAVIASRGSTSARLAGGLAGGLADPVQVGVMLATGNASTGLSLGKAILVDGLVNAGAVGVEMPAIMTARERLGEQTSAADALGEVAGAFAFGAAAAGTGRIIGAGVRALRDAVPMLGRMPASEILREFGSTVADNLRTPEQNAAANVLTRDIEVMAHNPFVPGMAGQDAHAARVNGAQRALVGGGDVSADYAAAVRRSESGGNAGARNPRSSAAGLYQFTDSTWLGVYRKEFPQSPLPDAAVLQLKGDAALQDRLFARLTRDNVATLDRAGLPADFGNAYLLHGLGPGDGLKVLRADPATPLSELLSPRVIDANPHMRGMTAGELVAWFRKRVGEKADTPMAPAIADDGGVAALNSEMAALDAEQATLNDAMARPDIHEVARGIDPALFRQYGDLQNRIALDRDAIARMGAARENSADAVQLRDRIATILDKVNGVEARLTKSAAQRLDDLRGSLDTMLRTDTPQMAMVRQRIQANDIQMRDLAPKVSDAYRRAAEALPAAPAAAPPGAAAPALNPALFASEEERHAAQAVVNAEAQAIPRSVGPDQGPFAPDGQGQPALAPPDAAMAPAEARTGAQAQSGAEQARVASDAPTGAAVAPVEPGSVMAMPDDLAHRFADPAGTDAQAQGDSAAHDLRAEIEAGRFPGVRFDTGDEAMTAERMLAFFDAEDAAIKAMEACL